MAYHSQQVFLLRHEQEKHLDRVLERKEKQGEEQQAFTDPFIRQHLNKSNAEHIIFILVATPVEEVGRDHDFDSAIIEPSSYRSIVQLAGRVRRHRATATKHANIGIMQYNLKAFKKNDKQGDKYFIRPGYEESIQEGLPFHDLTRLINAEHLAKNLNAIVRIQKLPASNKQFLAPLEHKATEQTLAQFTDVGANTLQGYLTEIWYLTALPQVLTPFRKSEASLNLFLFYNADKDCCYFTGKDTSGKPLLDENNQAINRQGIMNINNVELQPQEKENLWLERSYQELLNKYISDPWLGTKKTTLAVVFLSFHL
ncbi:MAG: hypothetical protein KAH18_08535 [Psychromonas sp.]|nr:hypothetical protein [Psychromonas sp.]